MLGSKSRRMSLLLATMLALLMIFAAAPTPGAVATSAEKLDEHLRAHLEDAPAAVRVIVTTVGAPDAAAMAAATLGGRVTWTYDIIDGFAATVPTASLDALTARADVRGVYLDRAVTTVMDVSSRAIEAEKAWAAGYDGRGITVAVIDTGIDPLHSFFTGAIVRCVSTIGGLVSPECTDSDGHGTHVAGTVASRDSKYPGVAPGASLAIVRVLHAAGAGTSSDIIAGMDWVRNNQNNVVPAIRVATMSIGFLEPGCGDDSGPEAQAANNLVASGVFFSVAAGNSGHDKCTIDGASAASRVATIAAIDDRGTMTQADDVIADFSSGGPTKDGRLKPDVAYPGVGITSAYIGAGVLVATLDGTSMATPHAAGNAAVLLQKEPTLSADQVKSRILGTAVKTDNTGSTANVVYGHGLGNVCRSLQLDGCAQLSEPTPPAEVHVAAIDMSFAHGGGKNPPHKVTTSVGVVDADGKAVGGASVAIRMTSPEGNVYTSTATTDSTGTATSTAQQRGGGHGTWEACVTGVSGTNLLYDSARNVETCETLLVS